MTNYINNICIKDKIPSTRDSRIDSIKGLLMLFVILGHIIGLCGTGNVNNMVREFLLSVDMPLFIFISGYFTKIKSDIKAFWSGLLPILVVLLIFHFINVFILCVIQGHNFGLKHLVTPYWTLWYLLSLLFWKIMLQYSPKALLNSPYVFIVIAIVISIFCGLMPNGRVFSIQRTLNFFPFFLFGYYVKQGIFKKRLWPNWMSWTIICVVIGLIVSETTPFESAKLLLRGADHYNIHYIPSKIYYLFRSFALIMSIFNVMFDNKFLSYIGRDTMVYYLYHGLVIKFLLQPIVVYYHAPTNFLYIVLYWMAVICLIFFIGKIKPLRWLCSPLPNKKK